MNPRIENLGNDVYKLGPLGTPKILSSYLIKDGENYALVDCGPAVVADELLDLAGSLGIDKNRIKSLLLTHIHIDHAGGAAKILENCPKCVAYIPRRGFKHMIDPAILNKSARAVLGDEIMNYWQECSPLPEERARPVGEMEVISVGTRKVKYIPATGHAPHHNVLHEEETSFLFAADSLGIIDPSSGAQTPTTPPPSLDLRQALLDIEMVRKVNAKVLCLAHYQTVNAVQEFFDHTLSVYDTWGKVVHTYLQESNKSSLEYSDNMQIFERLEEIFPEYRNVEYALKRQVTRIDIGGLAEYFSRLDRSER